MTMTNVIVFYMKGLISMNNIGKTPLIRATNLEKILGVKKIYLKIEGNNPTHSKYDRIAEVITKAALAKSKRTIIIDGNKQLLKAMIRLCNIENITLLVPLFKKENWKEKMLSEESLVNLVGVKKKDLDEVLLNLSINNQAFLVNESIFKQLSLIAMEEIAEELFLRYPGDINNVYYHGDDSLLNTAYHNVFLKHYINSEKKQPLISIARKDKSQTFADRLVDVNDTRINEAMGLLQKHEHLKVKTEDGIAFAAFLTDLNNKLIEDGRHVIVLDSAATRTNIKHINDYSEVNKKELVDYVEKYLDKYSDSKRETLEAVELAMKDGYILVVSREEQIDGICIIINLGIKEFIPTYHLAYIGIKPNSKGRGLGSELIKEAINVTNGNISLHVDLDNKTAKKLYKKMGFSHVYDRMIYQKNN